MFWAHRRQPGNNPESHKLSGQVLLNARSLSEVFRRMKLEWGASLVPEHFR